MALQPLFRRVQIEVVRAGLSITDLEGSLRPDEMGDGHIIGRLEPFLLRFVRDRGQDWVDFGLAQGKEPRFFYFADVQIALGWKTVEQVLDASDVQPLEDVLGLIASRWSEIINLLAPGNRFGWALLASVEKRRREAFMARLR